MRGLIWKDYRLNRSLLILGAAALVGSLVVGVAIEVPHFLANEQSCAIAQGDRIRRGGIRISFAIAKATLTGLIWPKASTPAGLH